MIRCSHGECGNAPLQEGEWTECTQCEDVIHPGCSYPLPVDNRGSLFDGVMIHRYHLRRLDNGGEDWALCHYCASSVAQCINGDNNDGRDGHDFDDEFIAGIIHDDVAVADTATVTTGNTNTGNADDDNSDDGESTVVLTNAAVVTENDEEGDVEGGEVSIPAEEEDVELTTEDVKQLISQFLQKVRPELMEKGFYRTHKKTMCYPQMLLKIQDMLDSNKYMTKHSFWYTVRAFFNSKISFDWYFDMLAKDIGVSSITQLNIIPDPQRGQWIASAGFELRIDGSDLQQYTKVGNTYSHSIPNFLLAAYGLTRDMSDEIDPETEPEPSTIEVVEGWRPNFIVTVEKLDWLRKLVGQGILKDEEIIIVSTMGYPTRNILACVHFLHKRYPDVPIVHCGDVGPTAVDLMLRFDYMKSTEKKFRVPIQWGFVRPSDVYEKSEVENALSGSEAYFSQRDSQAEARVRNSEWMNASPARMIELNRMRDAGKKYDMNDFEHAIDGNLKDFVLNRLRNKDWV